jgi:hypothetical protein
MSLSNHFRNSRLAVTLRIHHHIFSARLHQKSCQGVLVEGNRQHNINCQSVVTLKDNTCINVAMDIMHVSLTATFMSTATTAFIARTILDSHNLQIPTSLE